MSGLRGGVAAAVIASMNAWNAEPKRAGSRSSLSIRSAPLLHGERLDHPVYLARNAPCAWTCALAVQSAVTMGIMGTCHIVAVVSHDLRDPLGRHRFRRSPSATSPSTSPEFSQRRQAVVRNVGCSGRQSVGGRGDCGP